MGRKKLLKKLGEFFSMDQRARLRREDELKEILGRLKKKESELQARLDQETDSQKRERLASKIRVIRKQRKKGIRMLRESRVAHPH